MTRKISDKQIDDLLRESASEFRTQAEHLLLDNRERAISSVLSRVETEPEVSITKKSKYSYARTGLLGFSFVACLLFLIVANHKNDFNKATTELVRVDVESDYEGISFSLSDLSSFHEADEQVFSDDDSSLFFTFEHIQEYQEETTEDNNDNGDDWYEIT